MLPGPDYEKMSSPFQFKSLSSSLLQCRLAVKSART